MRWSQLQKQISERFAESLRSRIQIHSTQYGPGESSSQDRAWVTWDKQEIASFAGSRWWRQYETVAQQLRSVSGGYSFTHPDQRDAYYLSYEQAREITDNEGVFSRTAFHRSLFEYLSLSIDDALVSSDPIKRAFAVFDRRLGKRRLKQISSAELAHPLVKQFFLLRCQAEGLEITENSVKL